VEDLQLCYEVIYLLYEITLQANTTILCHKGHLTGERAFINSSPRELTFDIHHGLRHQPVIKSNRKLELDPRASPDQKCDYNTKVFMNPPNAMQLMYENPMQGAATFYWNHK